MQPDNQTDTQNNSQPDLTDSRENLNMYQPEPENDDVSSESVVVESVEEPKKSVEEPVYWTAKEYIDEEKNVLWFVMFAIIVLGLIAAGIFLLNSWTFAILVVVMAAAVIVYINRPPRDINYVLSGDQGLYIGEKLYHFNEFKAFGLIKDREHHSIMLIPTKRFAAGVSVYFPEEVGERIVDVLGARLPMETLKLDFVDVIVRKIRL